MDTNKFQDLVLEHLAKLTQEITEIKTDVSGLKTDVSGLKTDVSGLKTDVTGLATDVTGLKTNVTKLETNMSKLETDVSQIKASVIRIENDHGEKLRALFDAREMQIEVNERIFDALNRIEGKVDRLNLKVSAHDALLKKVN